MKREVDKKELIEEVMEEVTGKKKRPRGNPDFGTKIVRHQIPEGQEPNNAMFALRVKQSLLDKLKSLDNWQDAVREKLEELVKDV